MPRFVKQYKDVRLHVNPSDNKADLLQGAFDAAFWVGEPYDSALEAVKCIIETHLSRPGEWRLSKDQTISVRRGPLTSNSVRLTREAILDGMGIAFLPRFLIAEDIAAKRLSLVLTDYVSARLPL